MGRGNFKRGKDLPVVKCSCAKMAERIDMPFGIWTWVGPRNHVLEGVQIAPYEGAIFMGKDMLRHA